MNQAVAVSSHRRRVQVAEIVSSRYPRHQRPENWDARTAGTDVIRTTEGEEIRLASDGQQSPPQPGWVILLFEEDGEAGARWTLYGIPKGKR